MRFFLFQSHISSNNPLFLLGMFTHYIYLISLIHSNVIIIGYWISINWFYRTRNTYMNYRNTLFTNKFFDIIPYSLILFIVKIIIIKKGVSE